MSTAISAAVWKNSSAQGTALLLMVSLADQANDEGWCWPTIRLIAARCRVSERSVQRLISQLEAAGELTREERPGTSTRYRIHPQPVDNSQGRGDTAMSPRQSVGGDIAVSPHPRHSYVTQGVTTVSPRNISEPSMNQKKPTGSSAPAQPVDNSAQKLVAEWIDHCNGNRPPGRVVGQVAKEIGGMLNEGIPYTDVRAGLQVWQARGLHPSTLASVVHEIRTANGGGLKSRRQVETDSQFARMKEIADEIDRQAQAKGITQ